MRRAALLCGTGILLLTAVATSGRELIRLVAPVGGENVVRSSGEKLNFRLTADRADDGSLVVRLSVPPESELSKAAYYRLEIVRDGQVLLWAQLATRSEADGTVTAGLQIHESLAKDAYLSAAYEGNGARRPPLWAYRIPIADYVTKTK